MFWKKPQVAVPVLLLIGIFRILSGFSSVFDPKTDTKRKLPEKNRTIFFRHFSGFFKKCRRKNGKNTENKILKFRLLSVFCPSFLFLKFNIKKRIAFLKNGKNPEKKRKYKKKRKKNGKKTEIWKDGSVHFRFLKFPFFFRHFSGNFPFFSVFQNAIRFYFFQIRTKKRKKNGNFEKRKLPDPFFFPFHSGLCPFFRTQSVFCPALFC